MYDGFMSNIRYSIMILPRHANSILLRKFTDNVGQPTYDGFGSFYKESELPDEVAHRVLEENLQTKLSSQVVRKAAELKYYINKPTGLVDLNITVYFADISDYQDNAEVMQWFELTEIPYTQMHQATQKWLPVVLTLPELLKATVHIEQPDGHATGTVSEFTIN